MIEIVNSIAVLPNELFAHIVNVVEERISVGVPDIAPLLKVRPLGKVGVISQVEAATALLVGTIFIVDTSAVIEQLSKPLVC